MAVRMFAAIDVGSFALELGIYEISDKGIKSIDHVRHMIALGSDTFSEGKISYDLEMKCAGYWKNLRKP